MPQQGSVQDFVAVNRTKPDDECLVHQQRTQFDVVSEQALPEIGPRYRLIYWVEAQLSDTGKCVDYLLSLY
ncbi:MAG: hypothetical protein CBD32_01385 [Actinobacteria bacterium TMED172]|nr:MAG: hypothetical protein CBD32_01385 [Actinobacteria bacterium TMED172]